METKGKIYVADSDDRVVRVIRSSLEDHGYRVQEAMDWGLISEEAKIFGADLIFLSTSLPGVYYGDLLRRLKRNNATSDIPVILLCEKDEMRAVSDGIEMGAEDYIFKPLVQAGLLARVRLNLSAATQEAGSAPPGASGPADPQYEDDFGVLAEVSEAIASSLEPHDAFFILVRRVSQLIPVDRCAVVLRGIGQTEAFVVASHDNPNLRHHEIDLSRYPEYQRALESGEPVVIADARESEITRSVRATLKRIGLASSLVYPLIVREVPIGLLALTTRRESRGFSRRELLFTRAMTNLAAALVKATDVLEEVKQSSAAAKAPIQEFDNIELDLEDQIDVMIEELEG